MWAFVIPKLSSQHGTQDADALDMFLQYRVSVPWFSHTLTSQFPARINEMGFLLAADFVLAESCLSTAFHVYDHKSAMKEPILHAH